MDKAIADTWETAQEIKEKAVQDALDLAQTKHEKLNRKLCKQHEKAVKVPLMKSCSNFLFATVIVYS